MAYDTMMELIERFQSEGRDLDDLAAAVRALSEERKTPLGLNQWRLNDKPRMEEFNEDNRIIDRELSNKVDKVSYEEYDLEFIEGIAAVNSRRCTYSKDPFNRVHFILQAASTGSGIQNGTISALPEGFRPDTVVALPATGLNSSGRYLCTVDINPDGQVTIRFDGDVGTLNSIFSNGSFIAND